MRSSMTTSRVQTTPLAFPSNHPGAATSIAPAAHSRMFLLGDPSSLLREAMSRLSCLKRPPAFSQFGNQDSLHGPPQLCVNSAKGVVEPTNGIMSLIPRGSTWRENTLDVQRPERRSMGSRPPSCAQDHVIAERRRRERLNQQFLELSTIIPGLKKFSHFIVQTDKVSLLGDAINYIRQLEEKVKTLEEKASEKTVASTMLVKKSEHHRADNHISSSEANHSSHAFPKITASLDGNSFSLSSSDGHAADGPGHALGRLCGQSRVGNSRIKRRPCAGLPPAVGQSHVQQRLHQWRPCASKGRIQRRPLTGKGRIQRQPHVGRGCVGSNRALAIVHKRQPYPTVAATARQTSYGQM
ncbi:hypothetical protein BHM03_00058558 [Ensete ventricosum]|nr:hypothetical protein BHM03_00058558 [Ensete ventricosum]